MDFYDIAMRPPIASTCCSVNPWKSRLALNFKNADYTTKWIPIPDIPKVRRELDMPASRKHADGNDFYTLPVLIDPSTKSKMGDSFDIALFLQKTRPDSGAGDLFPNQKLNFTYDQELPTWAPPLSVRNDVEHADYSKFNSQVDMAFSVHVGLLGYYLPLDSQASKDEFIRRARVKSWDDFELKGEAREKMLESLHSMLGDLAKLFERDTSGPFMLGKQASYSDLIVGGWIIMISRLLPENEWKDVRERHGGVFGQLFDGLQKFTEVK